MPNTHSVDLDRASSQYLSITDAAQTGLDITGDISIECWIKLDQLPSTAGSIFNIVMKWNAAANQRSYGFFFNAVDVLSFWGSDNGGFAAGHRLQAQSTAAAVTADDVGKWVHLATTVDVSEGAAGILLYKNGDLIADSDVYNEATSLFNGTSIFAIGTRGDIDQFFDGMIDEVRVWNDIRTADEIKANWKRELVGDEANLVGYWKLNNSLLDETSNNNDLTNNNAATFSTDIPLWASAVPSITLLGAG